MKPFNPDILAIVMAGAVAGMMALGPANAQQRSAAAVLADAIENLRSSDAEWRREDAAYRRQQKSGNLSADDASEYAEFVASLKRQKLEDCEAVRKVGGNEALAGFDCVLTDKNAGASAPLPPPPSAAKTESEKLEGLEAELKRLESELDEELREKQQAIRERQQNRSGGGGALGQGENETAGAGGGGSATGGSQGNRPKWSEPPPEQSAGATDGTPATDVRTGKTAGSAGQEPSGATSRGPGGKAGPGAGQSKDKEANPTKTAQGTGEDGSDDDIVMRQIREAAERETDPVMKEKLWNEYRKLKAAKR